MKHNKHLKLKYYFDKALKAFSEKLVIATVEQLIHFPLCLNHRLHVDNNCHLWRPNTQFSKVPCCIRRHFVCFYWDFTQPYFNFNTETEHLTRLGNVPCPVAINHDRRDWGSNPRRPCIRRYRNPF